MKNTAEPGLVSGTKDKDFNLVSFVETCRSNALRLQTYVEDAERDGDSEIADFFRRAQTESRTGQEQTRRFSPAGAAERHLALLSAATWFGPVWRGKTGVEFALARRRDGGPGCHHGLRLLSAGPGDSVAPPARRVVPPGWCWSEP